MPFKKKPNWPLEYSILHLVGIACCKCLLYKFVDFLQAGILAVGRGNKVVEVVIGSDGKKFVVFYTAYYMLLVTG